MPKVLIINADDFGYARGVNRGVIAVPEQGAVLSTSLMVDTPLTAEAVALARRYPNLGVGLHFTADLNSSYAAEREIELATLLDPRVLGLIRELGITLTNFAALPHLLGGQDVITRPLTGNLE